MFRCNLWNRKYFWFFLSWIQNKKLSLTFTNNLLYLWKRACLNKIHWKKHKMYIYLQWQTYFIFLIKRLLQFEAKNIFFMPYILQKEVSITDIYNLKHRNELNLWCGILRIMHSLCYTLDFFAFYFKLIFQEKISLILYLKFKKLLHKYILIIRK